MVFTDECLSLNRLQVNETIVKGCVRWNTEKYQIGTYACDTPNCNKDLDAGDCAHVCDERKAGIGRHDDVPRSPKVAVKKQVLQECNLTLLYVLDNHP